ncbi:MAG: alpha/beta fold hydrolase [Candidatus Dadabacteria bacterium]
MPIDKINGVNLYWERTGEKSQPALLLVHGSWGDHHNWDRVVHELSKDFQVITYDRRGHSHSERPPGQGSMEEDVEDLLALIKFLGIAPLHLAGNSGGAAISLKAVVKKPELFKTLVIHEPPLFGVLKSNAEAQDMLRIVSSRIEAVVNLLGTGENEQAAKLFVDTIAFGPGGWDQLPLAAQQTFIFNAPTFLDENGDPGGLDIDLSSLSSFTNSALLSNGTQSPPFFLMTLDLIQQALPNVKRIKFDGAGHVPHLTHPVDYVEVISDFCLQNEKINA